MAKVSIILPTYNGANFIAKAIESVSKQTFQDWELLVLSDGSIDHTSSIVEQFSVADPRITFIQNENNLGIQKTLNKGISLSSGKYIARIDDDDRWINPNKITQQVQYMELHDDYVLVGTDANIIDAAENLLSVNRMPKTDKEIRQKILSKNCFLHSTVLIRKSAIDVVGGYQENKNFLHAEDYEFWLRLGRVGKFCNLALIGVQLTNHVQSLTSKNRILQAKNIFRMIKGYKKDYPNFLIGYLIARTRYAGFVFLKYIPMPKSLIFWIQRIYKKV